jgi:SAM-dependent methyltransferase
VIEMSSAIARAGRRISLLRRWRYRIRELARRDRGAWTRVGHVDLGSLGSTAPISRSFGRDRGTPIDRHYIEAFLESSASSIRGRVLEVGDDEYTRRFGKEVTRSDVLHVSQESHATVISDLRTGLGIEDATFDCVICTQTLQFIDDVPAALATIHRVLAPGGTALITAPGISQISRYDMDRWGEYWRFTSLALRRLAGQTFGDDVQVRSYGNVLAAVGMLHGLARDEFDRANLDFADPDYEVVVACRARKAQ